MTTGKIKKLIRDRGFGFIARSDGGELFFHRSGLQGVDFDSLREGQKVRFDIEKSPKGPRAIRITPLEGEEEL